MRILAGLLLLPFAATLVVCAQTAPRPAIASTGTANQTVQIYGVYTVPVANQPFSATEHMVLRQPTTDGGERVLQTTLHIARSSSGMTFGEGRSLVAGSWTGEPRLRRYHLYDPNSLRYTLMDAETHIARQVTEKGPRPPAVLHAVSATPQPGLVETDLGPSTIEGIPVQGLSRVRTLNAAQSGTGKELQITDELWFAPSLSIYLKTRHLDPRTGEQVVELSAIDRGEPDSIHFRVPDDYRIVDETPMPTPARH